ncbi:hypothetical protein HY988_01865 [Candidatus Micrarchaeota archaeon]|nr:hypothetical protein [Candidatus Micrarchaeota archaeon]
MATLRKSKWRIPNKVKYAALAICAAPSVYLGSAFYSNMRSSTPESFWKRQKAAIERKYQNDPANSNKLDELARLSNLLLHQNAEHSEVILHYGMRAAEQKVISKEPNLVVKEIHELAQDEMIEQIDEIKADFWTVAVLPVVAVLGILIDVGYGIYKGIIAAAGKMRRP